MEKLYVITETWGRYEEATVSNIAVALTAERAQQEVDRLTQAQEKAIEEHQDFEQEISGPLRASKKYRSFVYDSVKVPLEDLMEFVAKQLGDKWREFHEKRGYPVPEISFDTVFARRRVTEYVYEFEEVPVID